MLTPASSSDIGVIVIGRNEGERLIRALKALQDVGARVLYVDSASSDGSAVRVRAQFPAVIVIELDASTPLSAARARNEGARCWAAQPDPPTYLQFVDGDCVVLPGWLEAAHAYLESHGGCAAVVGPLQEMHPEASVYNRLCALEWKSGVGEIEDCGLFGGLSMVRASVFEALGGFNPRVIAGEDSEFAVRMRLAGHKVTKLAQPMAQHDASMTRFAEFWTRSIRSGHAIGQRFDLHGRGPARDCAKDLRSVKVWGMALPATSLVLAAFTQGWGLLLWPAALLVLHMRVVSHRRRTGDDAYAAHLYAGSTVLAKYAQVIGLFRYWLRRSSGQFRLIEYK
jgi:GT2 family glycosyltransferase